MGADGWRRRPSPEEHAAVEALVRQMAHAQGPPIQRRPDGVWHLTCTACGCVLLTRDLFHALGPRYAEPDIDCTGADTVLCPGCYDPPWAISFPA